MLVGPVAFAADNGSRQPGVGAAVQADKGVEAILRQVTRQIAMGHTLAPEGNNALASWQDLLKSVLPASPVTKKALRDFTTQMRDRAAKEQAAGRPGVAADFSVFAEEANGLLQHEGIAPGPSSVAEQPNVRTDTALPTDMAPHDARPAEIPEGPAPLGPLVEPWRTELGPAPAGALGANATSTPMATEGHNAEPIKPAPAPPNTAAASLVPAPHSNVTAPTVQQQAAAAALASRGDAMLALQDISAARLFYERSADAGSARAAMALAETYDPAFLAKLGVVGTKSNSAMAEEWYRKAAALGNRSAEARLQTLGLAAVR